jgi:hypothetical protein
VAERNPWEPKPWLEERPWSLLPNLDLPRWSPPVAVSLWLVVVAGAYLSVAPGWARLVSTAVVGSWSVYYLACRLGGRAAPTGGASQSIRVDSPFQARLAFDIMAIAVLVTSALALFAQ